jgi:hypothetical protein
MVYTKNRTKEKFKDFQKKYWTDSSIFKKADQTFEQYFKILAKNISWNNKSVKFFKISAVASLFKSIKLIKSKREILKKNSYKEFLNRSIKTSRNRSTVLKPFFSKYFKFDNFDLTKRRFKIIDYGNCYDYTDERYGLINTRQYRAPEVILSKI